MMMDHRWSLSCLVHSILSIERYVRPSPHPSCFRCLRKETTSLSNPTKPPIEPEAILLLSWTMPTNARRAPLAHLSSSAGRVPLRATSRASFPPRRGIVCFHSLILVADGSVCVRRIAFRTSRIWTDASTWFAHRACSTSRLHTRARLSSILRRRLAPPARPSERTTWRWWKRTRGTRAWTVRFPAGKVQWA